MEHATYKRIVRGADTAILFIHGIAGTPNHFRPFLPLVPETVSVCNLLLDGHGGGVRDFSRTSMEKWEAQIAETVRELTATHKEVYIVAHSMGTLFAIEQAIQNDRIAGLFLLAVPIKLFIKPRMLRNTTLVYLDKVSPSDPVATAAKECYGIRTEKNPLRYLGWIPRYLELFAKIRRTRKLLPLLQTPTVALQSMRDEMVARTSADYLSEHSVMRVIELVHAGHYYYPEAELNTILSEFRGFIAKE